MIHVLLRVLFFFSLYLKVYLFLSMHATDLNMNFYSLIWQTIIFLLEEQLNILLKRNVVLIIMFLFSVFFFLSSSFFLFSFFNSHFLLKIFRWNWWFSWIKFSLLYNKLFLVCFVYPSISIITFVLFTKYSQKYISYSPSKRGKKSMYN